MDHHRKICNIAKKDILRKTCRDLRKNGMGDVCLLDLCCGRGGDLFKWNACKITKVIGIDNHSESIEEANRRYSEGNIGVDVVFYVDTSLNMDKYVNSSKMNIVSCNFALHYFDRGDLVKLVKNVSKVLPKGGYFIGTCIDGDIVRECLDNGDIIDNVDLRDNEDGTYGINLYYGEDKMNTEKRTKSYFDYRSDFEYSREYYIEKNVFVNLCRTCGLELIQLKNLEEYKGNHISRLYFSFIFKKL